MDKALRLARLQRLAPAEVRSALLFYNYPPGEKNLGASFLNVPRSLEALLEEDLQWLAPGHGFLVDQPHAVLRALIAHRLGREAKVVAALRPL